MILSLLTPPSLSTPFLPPFKFSTPSSISLHKRRRFRVSFPLSSAAENPTSISITTVEAKPNNVFGGKRELTGIQPLVDSLSPPLRVASSAIILAGALAAGYGLGTKFGGGSRNLAVGGAAVAGVAGGAVVYALNGAVPEVAAIGLHNYVAGCDDPKDVRREDIEGIARKYGVSKQDEAFNAELCDLYCQFVSSVLPPGSEELKGIEVETIVNFKNALGIDDPDAANMHMEIGRRIFRQRLETGDREGDVEQRRAFQKLIYVSTLVFGEASSFLLPWKRVFNVTDSQVEIAIRDNAQRLYAANLNSVGKDIDVEQLINLRQAQLSYRLSDELAEDLFRQHTRKVIEENVSTALGILKSRTRTVQDVAKVVVELDKILAFNDKLVSFKSHGDAALFARGVGPVSLLGGEYANERKLDDVKLLYRAYITDALSGGRMEENKLAALNQLRNIFGLGKREAESLTLDITSKVYRKRLAQAVQSGDLEFADSKAAFLQNLCEELRFDTQKATEIHEEIYRQKLQQFVADGELSDEDVKALTRLRVMFCIPQQTVDAAHSDICGSLFEKVVKDAIASGVDGYDADVKKAVRKAAHGLRLTREAAMSIASKAVRRVFINYIKIARSAENRTEAAKELKKLITFNKLVVTLAHQNLKNQAASSSGVCEDEVSVDPFVRTIEWSDVSLRQWLDKPERSVDEFECLHIFRQIVEIVNMAHSQGIVVHNVRPSCFVMSSFNHVSFIESASCSDSGSDSLDDELNGQTVDNRNSSSSLPNEMCQQRSGLESEHFRPVSTPTNALSEASCMQSSSVYAADVPLGEETEENKIGDTRNVGQEEERKQPFPMKQILLMESSWYTSPEEVDGSSSTCDSDIYRLGVLLFELFCPFTSREDKSRTMSSLRHRVLPPQLLLKWPKEASFCLWLLHPEPSSRPKMSELLQCEFLNEPRDNLEEREAAIQLGERIEEQELLLEFLMLIQQRKQDAVDKLQHTVSLLCSDIEEVMKHRMFLKEKGALCIEKGKDDHLASNFPTLNIIDDDDSSDLGSRKRFRLGRQIHNVEEFDDNLDEGQNSVAQVETQESPLFRSSRLMKNFKKLESAYFLTRCRPIRPSGKPSIKNSPIHCDGRGSIVVTERSSIDNLAPKERFIEGRQSGWISPFLEGLCKYLSYSKLKVKADLKQGDLLNSPNLVCSLSFDRDGEFFATAGVNKKIKVFECDAIINETRDIHYPVVEMASRSKLSSICWNSYIKSQIASSNFEGVVQVWDVTRSQVLTEMREHERRVWSIDFSSADPTMLASGSDDGSVKLWSINQGVSIGTIKTKVNVCSVQFPLHSSRSIAFGSADHRIYYYDLRNAKVPLCTLVGHNKTVSYVKFVDPTNIVSASTDNTLKLWDLSICTSRVIDSPLQSFTGHMNVKNFVGLSVSDGYIATGSETNEVFVYHKAFPMPAMSFKFNNTDPLSGLEMDDTAQFISSVCWRGQSSTLVAANSTGNIKILEMV